MATTPHFRILVIDDNPAIHKDFIKILTAENSSSFETLKMDIFGKSEDEDKKLPQFEIDVASQGQEGVMRIKDALQEGRPYSLAFVDIRMPPGWDGIETIKHIWELDKDIQIVICTAYSDYSWEETVSHLGKTDNLLILKKPFDNISVRQLACALTMKWQLAEEARHYTDLLEQQVADKTLSLQKSLSLIKSTFESSSDGILVVNLDGEIIDYNHRFIEMFLIPQEVLQHNSANVLIDHLKTQFANEKEFIEKLRELNTKLDQTSIDIFTLKNNNVFECYSQPHKLNGKIIGRILDFRDVTKRAKLESELQFQATHDALTGLANRVELLKKLQEIIKTANQNKEQFAVLFLDFDRFKLINDSLSHIAGDELLCIAAKRLLNVINKQDVLARLGGDEFVIVYSDVENETDVIDKVKRLLSVFKEPFAIANRNVTLTVSVGIALFPQNGTSVDLLLRNADAAMYRAKAKKGNNFQFYCDELNKQTLAELDQEIELRHAIENHEFFLCYQPQIDLQDEKIVAVEALLRWHHPTKGVLLPIDFIPLAEETGLIIPIGEWVLRTACQQNKKWQTSGFPPIRVAVNLTAQQFKQQNIPRLIEKILKESDLQPHFLEVELTENVILSNREIIRAVTELKKIGVIVAIDDFGTGYSSLSYLHKIPLDRLKIDSSFIQHIHSAKDDEVIIRAVIAMAKNLNLEVLAEGVETIEQVNFLKKYQCEDVQGFYFSKPLSNSELEKYLKNPAHLKNYVSSTTESK